MKLPRKRTYNKTQKVVRNKRKVVYKTSLKESNFNRWKSQQLRSSWRARYPEHKELIPKSKEIEAWLNKQELMCHYSGTVLEPTKFEADHRIPVNLGGSVGLDNIVLCTTRMNRAKGNMTEDEFTSLLLFLSSWEDKGEKIIRRLGAANTIFRK